MSVTAPISEPFPVPRMRAIDGATELAVATAAGSARSRPEAVTAVLGALLTTIGDLPASRDAVRALPSATREWLLQWSAAHLHPEIRWFEVNCTHCGEPLDLSIDLSRSVCRPPSKPASQVTVATSFGMRSFAVPTGDHEERFARLGSSGDPRRDFARLCGTAPTAREDADQFGEHDLALIDEALEAASPDIADEVQIPCPSCGKETTARIDPLRYAFAREADILGEVHLIARGYGWSAQDILILPSRHRAWFAERIARERRAGMPVAGRV